MKSPWGSGRWMRATALIALLEEVATRHPDADVRVNAGGRLRVETPDCAALGYIDLGDEELVWYDEGGNGGK